MLAPSTNPKPINTKAGFVHGIDIFLLASSLKKGNDTWARPNAKTNATATIKKVSVKNCQINCERVEPIDLRIPTSLARVSDCAVLKFIKLLHASNSTKTPIAANSQTN